MIWKEWSAKNGNGLHRLQKMILMRGCELLKVGGRLVYSTCTFNPIENEAVVASMLLQGNGALRLVDVSNELPGLRRKPGITSWQVKDKNGQFHKVFNKSNEAKDHVESMFPPQNAGELGLDKCIRIYPFLQNTGGFFVAVFEKVKQFGSVDKYNQRRKDKKNIIDDEEFEELENLVSKEILTSDSLQTKRQTEVDPADTSKKFIKVDSDGNKIVAVKKEQKGWSGIKESPFIFVSDENETIQKCWYRSN